MNKLFVGRELQMVELKEKVATLKERGRHSIYSMLNLTLL